ncbi:MAG: hypothetical protein KDD31_09440 [Muricauda sp.]|nr:hypothetical protein [Allomuricauda sp.]
MKTKTLFIILAFLSLSNSIIAQDDDDFMSMDVFDLTDDDLDISGQFMDEVFNRGDKNAESKAKWRDLKEKLNNQSNDLRFKLYMSELSKALGELENESDLGKCLTIMGAYAQTLAYCDFRLETASDPCEKKEWLGIVGLMLMTGTSINYCPQEFYGLSDESLDPEEQTEIRRSYDNEITKYFFGNMLTYGGKFENTIKSDELEEKLLKVLNDGTEQYLKNHGKSNIGELNPEEKERYELWLLKTLEDYKSQYKYEIPHMVLYWKFVNANQQLGLPEKISYDSDGFTATDFVGKMFTPEYMLAKTFEIAKLSNKYKCSN